MQNAEREWLWSSVLSESSFRTVSQYSEPNMEPDSLSFLPLITKILSIYHLFASITIIDDACKLEIGQWSIYTGK